MKKTRYTEEQIIGAIKEHEAGAKVDDICRKLSISSGTFYNWRSKYAGLEVNEAKRLRELDSENNKLKKLLADKLLEVEAMKDVLSKIICDNGTEFTSKAMFFWSKETGVTLGFIQPGKPTQNAFVESLNGKFRNECLNRSWFRTMDEARVEIDSWREHCNHVRPHSSLNYLSPVEYARRAA